MSERLKSVTQVWIDDETNKTRTVKTEYDADGNAIAADPPVAVEGALPDDFPGKAALMRAKLASIEAIRDYLRSRPLTLIEGIDPNTADAIKAIVVATPEPSEEASAIPRAFHPNGGVASPNVFATRTSSGESAKLSDDTRKPVQGQLPPEFPGFEALAKAGIHTFDQARKAGDLTEIEGIGEATAAKIQPLLDETVPA